MRDQTLLSRNDLRDWIADHDNPYRQHFEIDYIVMSEAVGKKECDRNQVRDTVIMNEVLTLSSTQLILCLTQIYIKCSYSLI